MEKITEMISVVSIFIILIILSLGFLKYISRLPLTTEDAFRIRQIDTIASNAWFGLALTPGCTIVDYTDNENFVMKCVGDSGCIKFFEIHNGKPHLDGVGIERISFMLIAKCGE